MSGLRERMTFDPGEGEYRDGPIRYLMMRSDVLMGLFAELPTQQRLSALEALGRSVQEFGGRSVMAYQAAGATEPNEMLDTIAATAGQLGWGAWAFERKGSSILLGVRNSPFAAAAGSAYPVCHAVCGMLAAVGRVVLQAQVHVTETRCAACDGGDTCRFQATGTPATTEARAAP